MDFPNAVLYIQREELKGIEWALNYPNPHISAVNTDPGGCMRTPACGYPPKTLDEIYGKVLSGKAVIVDGEMEVLPGVKIHPAFRAHTAGSQLLEVPTSIGKLVFGSDAYFVLGRHPRLDDRQPAADRHGAAVPRLREVLQDHRRLPELRRARMNPCPTRTSIR